MRYLMLLFLVSCSQSPKFKVGDCVVGESKEQWEINYISEIRAVGKEKYLLIDYELVGTDWSEYFGPYSMRFDELDDGHVKIECPIEPHEFDKLRWKEPRPR